VLSLRKLKDPQPQALLITAQPKEPAGEDGDIDLAAVQSASLLIPRGLAANGFQPGTPVRVQRLRKDVLSLTHVILMAATQEAYLVATEGGMIIAMKGTKTDLPGSTLLSTAARLSTSAQRRHN